MNPQRKTPKHTKLDEHNHVEMWLLDQLADLGWKVIEPTDRRQMPADSHRESFTEVVKPPFLRKWRATSSLT